MRPIILLGVLSLPAGALAADSVAPSPQSPAPLISPRAAPWLVSNTRQKCARDNIHRAAPVESPGAKTLEEMPPGNLTLAVYREVGGCPTPVIVRHGIGGGEVGGGAPARSASLRPLKL